MKLTLEHLEARVCPAPIGLAPLEQFAGLLAQAEALVQSWEVAHPLSLAAAAATATPVGYTPAQIAHAYSFDQIFFSGGVPGNGAGQTIAVVDAFHNPTIASDLHAFDVQFGLPDPPSLTVLDQYGAAPPPLVDPTGGWTLEADLDVEWAHAMAPAANIVLVESNSSLFGDLFMGVYTAAHLPAVSVISMSWSGSESLTESVLDAVYLQAPPDHQGITFVAASGDNGAAAGAGYPASSPNVLSVGGTILIGSQEAAWAGSGGGLSQFTSEPHWQLGAQLTGHRTSPDVSYNAGVPFAVYDSNRGGWIQVRGTSAGAPQWAALIAIANQGRNLAGLGSLDGPSQTLPMIYQTAASAFYDIIGGSNGYVALPGYDLATGRGSPIAYLVAAGLTPNVDLPVGARPTPPPDIWYQLADLMAIPGQQFRSLAFRALSLIDARDFASRTAAAQSELAQNPMLYTQHGENAAGLGWAAFAQILSQ